MKILAILSFVFLVNFAAFADEKDLDQKSSEEKSSKNQSLMSKEDCEFLYNDIKLFDKQYIVLNAQLEVQQENASAQKRNELIEMRKKALKMKANFLKNGCDKFIRSKKS